ncbi:hypothetical protein CRYUN_Cryun05aG0126100 [Craigia yunnanensis]
MSTEMVMVDEIPFPPQITTIKPLSLLGHGITDIEIHFLQIKFTAIGVYLEPEVVGHLQQWKGKPGNVLAEDDDFFEALINAPVEQFLRVVVIKEIKGSQYGVQLESAVRDRLAAVDKYEEEEEEALEKVVEFFQSKYFKKDSIITYHFPANSGTVEVVYFEAYELYSVLKKPIIPILLIMHFCVCALARVDCIYYRGKGGCQNQSGEC